MNSNHHFSNRRVLSASFSNGLFFFVQSFVFLALTPLTLHTLGKEVYGLWTIMLAVLGLSNLAQFGTDTAIAKYTAQYSIGDDRKDKFSAVLTFSYIFVLLTGVLISLAIWLSRYWVAQIFRVDSILAESLPAVFGLMSLGIIPGFLFSASRGVLLGLIQNDLANGLDVGTNIVMWVGALVIGLRGGDVTDLALWIVIVNVLRFLLSGYFALRVTADYHLHFVLDVRTVK